MKYWYGFRVIELDGSNPGSKCLSESFNSYNEAKNSKQKSKARDMEHTRIFSTTSKGAAKEILLNEQFSKL